MPNSETSLSGHSARFNTIVGREREKTFLRECLDAMVAGHGSFVLVSGQAGIGKTTLVEWLQREAEQQGCLALRGSCYDLTITPPYGPWLELARAYRPASGEPPPPSFLTDPAALAAIGSQESLFALVFDFLATLAALRPTLLILEDLHWVDSDSIGLLRTVGRRLADHRILLVATLRSDDLLRQHPLYTMLPMIVREAGAERLDVRPLSGDENKALIRALYSLPHEDQLRLEQYVGRRSEGNPLFASELLRTLEDEGFLQPDDGGRWQLRNPEQLPVPPFVRQVIERRLGRLDDETRQLLQIAAVIGDEVPLELWQRVSEASDEALLAAIQHGQELPVIDEVPTRHHYRFRHGLLRQALYEEAIAPRRRLWHRRIAELLESTPLPDPDSVAYHFQQAGDQRTVQWLMKAGERAERAFAWIVAADRFEAAALLLNEQGAPAVTRALLLLRIANIRWLADPPRAITALEDARKLALDTGEAGLASLALFSVGAYQCASSALRQGLSIMDRALAEFRALPEAEKERVALLSDVRGNTLEGLRIPWLATAGRLRESIERAESILAEDPFKDSQREQDAMAHAGTHLGLGIARAAFGYPDPALQSFHQARAIYQAMGHHAMVAITSASELGIVHLPFFPEDLSGQRSLATLGEESARKASGAIPDSVTPRLVSLYLLIRDGEWEEAYEVASSASRNPVASINTLGRCCLATLSHSRGDPGRAMEIIQQILPQGPATEIGNIYFLAGMLLQRTAVFIALDQHDLDTARAWLEAHDRWLADCQSVLGVAEGELCWARYYLGLGDAASARARAERALSLASHPRQRPVSISVHRFLGELAVAGRRYADAARHFDESLALADACADRYKRALTLLSMAELHLAEGRVEEAGVSLNEARGIFESLGARPDLVRADALAARLVAAPRPAPSFPAGLTVREVEVLRLVAEGLTDAEVADRLYLSPRTVSAHLRSVYNKIGVGSRAAAARFAVENGLL